MVRRCLLFVLSGYLFASSAAAFAGCSCPSWREVSGEYNTVEVIPYRGGQTPRAEAMAKIEARILVSESQFALWNDERYSEPVYEVNCYPTSQEEGEVQAPTERRGDFYGFGIDRDAIKVLGVTPSREEGPSYHFEVVGDELWFFFDGWFYRAKRISSK